MPLVIGSRLGSYIVSGTLGAGGMGEVYRANDSRLGRDVALKTLPEEFAGDADRMARFEREARVLASLNHPHIAALYGIEEADGVRALVMELVEGPTLEDRLRDGPLALEDAVKIARQVADALEYAHEHNVVHRDLKPANVKVTPEGMVKVLDFGLAKAAEARETSIPVNSPTLTMRATQAGVILGTAGYMSPEQASGKPVDKRSDVWSFGVLLFEMLTGKALFGGETLAHTMADVLRADVPFDRLPAAVPANLRTLLERCLERDLRTRLRDIGEARIALERYRQLEPDRVPPKAQPSRRWLWALAAGVLIGAVAGVVGFRQAPMPEHAVEFEIPLPPKTVFGAYNTMALSPDGKALVLETGMPGRDRQLWIRRLDSAKPQPIAGSGAGSLPFWSPDSRAVAFTEWNPPRLRSAGLEAGVPPVTLSDASARGGAWSPDGLMLLGNLSGTLHQIQATGGARQPVLDLDKERLELGQAYPQFLPGGKQFLYFSRSADAGKSGIYSGMIGSKSSRHILSNDTAGLYAAPGYLLFTRQSTLFAQPFDASTLTLRDRAIPIAEGVGRSTDAGISHFTVSQTGTLAYRSGVALEALLTVFNRDGKKLHTLGTPMIVGQVTASLDGERLLLDRLDPGTFNYDIWMLELRSGVLSRITTDPGSDRDAVFAPSGKEIVFSSIRGSGPPQLYRKVLGGGPEQRILETPDRNIPEAFSVDGGLLFGNRMGRGYYLLYPGDAQPKLVYESGFMVDEPAISPDGKWIAMNTSESGAFEVYLARFPEFTERRQLSVNGGVNPLWRKDGREIVYLAGDGGMMSVKLTPGTGGLEPAPPVKLFDTRLRPNGATQQFAISPDAGTFYIPVQVSEVEPPITVVINWPAKLKKAR